MIRPLLESLAIGTAGLAALLAALWLACLIVIPTPVCRPIHVPPPKITPAIFRGVLT